MNIQNCYNPNHRKLAFREGLPAQMFPKSRHCQDGGGLTPVWIFWRICPHALMSEGPQMWSFITKKWYFKTVFLIPQNRSFNHIYLTFSLSNMIYAPLSKKCRKWHLRTCMGQIAQDAWIGGASGMASHPIPPVMTYRHKKPLVLKQLHIPAHEKKLVKCHIFWCENLIFIHNWALPEFFGPFFHHVTVLYILTSTCTMLCVYFLVIFNSKITKSKQIISQLSLPSLS